MGDFFSESELKTLGLELLIEMKWLNVLNLCMAVWLYQDNNNFATQSLLMTMELEKILVIFLVMSTHIHCRNLENGEKGKTRERVFKRTYCLSVNVYLIWICKVVIQSNRSHNASMIF